MITLVIFDSNFGNTKIIAEIIAKVLDAKAVPVSNFNSNEIEGIDLLIVGSPIIAWKPSEKMIKFLESLTNGQLRGIKATTFDTRVKLFIHGDAAKKIANHLERAGAKIIVEPQGFFVKGREGPLFEDEIEKATKWAETIKSK